MSNKLHPLHSHEQIMDYMRTLGEYFDPTRATGRTEQLVLIHIAEAMGKPHRWVDFRDHYSSQPACRRLGERCREVVKLLGYEHFTFQADRMCFGSPPCLE